jgi:hypothetical protein
VQPPTDFLFAAHLPQSGVHPIFWPVIIRNSLAHQARRPGGVEPDCPQAEHFDGKFDGKILFDVLGRRYQFGATLENGS